MKPNRSGRPNRVAPDGSGAAVADRGLFWGNRGQLLNSRGEIVRHSQGRNWIICVLQFHGRHRVQWQPNRLTELYFLDEATALAAGHRPCGECRYADYQRFRSAWAAAHGSWERADDIDRKLHGERLADGQHPTHGALLADLPEGVVVRHEGDFWLVLEDRIHRWTFSGYDASQPRTSLPAFVDVQTPPSTVAVLAAGYEPVMHPSAQGHDPDHPVQAASKNPSSSRIARR